MAARKQRELNVGTDTTVPTTVQGFIVLPRPVRRMAFTAVCLPPQLQPGIDIALLERLPTKVATFQWNRCIAPAMGVE